MRTILIHTVGGTHQPIVRSIQQRHPDFVHFLCSADSDRTKGSYIQIIGEGKVLKSAPNLDQPDLPNIVKLTNLSNDQYKVHQIKQFDNLDDCYLTALSLIEQLHQRHPEATLIADYTGGTKSMTAGLAAAALDDGRCEIQLVTGVRRDLTKVMDHTEFVRPMAVWDTQVRRRMRVAGELIARFDYASAVRSLEDTAARFASDATIARLQRWLSLCRAFDAWDRFDHVAARQLLQPYGETVDPYKGFLALTLEGRGHGFELVEDLLLNAERRAAQGRYDDAVGRLYRAVELTAQAWLKQKHGIETDNVVITSAPESVRERLDKERDDKGIIGIGLMLAWGIIAAFSGDKLGEHFKSHRSTIVNFLEVRNQSLFAHGTRPVTEMDYMRHAPNVSQFVRQAMDHALLDLKKKRFITLPQLPTEWE